LFREFRSDLAASHHAREIANLVLTQRPEGAAPAVQAMFGRGVVVGWLSCCPALPALCWTLIALVYPLCRALR